MSVAYILAVDLARVSDTMARAMLTGRQIRAALGLLGKNVAWLAETSIVSESTIRRAVLANGIPNMRTESMSKLQRTLEAAGCLFLDPDDVRPGGEGVRLRP
jgi:hypothetical protein